MRSNHDDLPTQSIQRDRLSIAKMDCKDQFELVMDRSHGSDRCSHPLSGRRRPAKAAATCNCRSIRWCRWRRGQNNHGTRRLQVF